MAVKHCGVGGGGIRPFANLKRSDQACAVDKKPRQGCRPPRLRAGMASKKWGVGVKGARSPQLHPSTLSARRMTR